MSTANKLTYLNTTKTMLRDSLNKFGSNILTTDTFRSYDTKLNDIYNKLPKITQSGAGFTLENVQNGLVDDFKMIGVDLQQKTTTGKNLFKASSSNYPQGLNITYDSDKGTITFSGTTTGTYPTLSNFTEANIPAGTYTFSIDKALPYNLSCRFRNSSGEYPSTVIISAGELSKSITLSYDAVRLELVYSVTNVGVTIPTTTIKPMVEPGSTATNWEKYSGGNPAPNPDYPQEIKVVDGRQVITDKGKNLFDVSQTPHSNSLPGAGVITTLNNDGTISTSGTNTETYRNIRYDIQLPAGEYIISGCPAGGSKNGYSLLVQLTDETSSQVFETGSGATFTLTETTTVKFYPVRVGSETVNFNGLIFKPMIMLANISNDTFEPYYEPVSYNIDLHGKNEFDGEYEDGYYNMNGIKSSTQDPYGRRSTNLNKIEPNTNYSISINNNIISETIRLFYYDANRGFISTESISNGTFTTPAECYYVSWHSSSLKQNYPDGIPNMMIEQGQTVTTYEDYYDYKLAKMPNTDYKNRIYKNNGNWYFEENVEKVILDGSENWSGGSAGLVKTNYRYLYTTIDVAKNFNNLCDCFESYITNVMNASLNVDTDTIGLSLSSSNNLRLLVNENRLQDVSTASASVQSFKTWLQTHNITFWYILENPVTTQITNTTLISQLEAISVHTGTNIFTITNDNNIIPEIEITRLKELERLQ